MTLRERSFISVSVIIVAVPFFSRQKKTFDLFFLQKRLLVVLRTWMSFTSWVANTCLHWREMCLSRETWASVYPGHALCPSASSVRMWPCQSGPRIQWPCPAAAAAAPAPVKSLSLPPALSATLSSQLWMTFVYLFFGHRSGYFPVESYFLCVFFSYFILLWEMCALSCDFPTSRRYLSMKITRRTPYV